MLKTRYTAEELMEMKPEELGELVERLVGRPEPDIVQAIHESWLRKNSRPRQLVPEYSSSYMGLHYVMKTIESMGFSVEVGPDDAMWFSKDGKEHPRTLWAGSLPKTIAITAVLAVQGE